MRLLQHRRLILCRSNNHGAETLLNYMLKRSELSTSTHSRPRQTCVNPRTCRRDCVPRFSCTFKHQTRCYSVLKNSAWCKYLDDNCVGFTHDKRGIEHLCVKASTADDSNVRKWKHGYLWIVGLILAGAATTLVDSLQAAEEAEDQESARGEAITSTDTLPEDKVDQAGHSVKKVSPSLLDKIYTCQQEMKKQKEKIDCPGISVAVSVNGKTVWAEGFGLADIENDVPCTPRSLFRIASISKSITMAAVARLWEEGKLDLDKPVQHYVPEFPEKTWKGEKVSITTRQLVTHQSGIRHYGKKYMAKKRHTDVQEILKKHCSINASGEKFISSRHYVPPLDTEIYNKKMYHSVIEALDVFKDDPLRFKPGTDEYYSSFGWVLVSAVVEKVAGIPFEKYMRTVLDDLGLKNTHYEKAAPIIYNRGRHYNKVSKKGSHVNCPYIDVSHKMASEGLLSNVLDMNKYGNAMLYSYQTGTRQDKFVASSPTNHKADNRLDKSKDGSPTPCPGYLKGDTMQQLWRDTWKDHRKRGNRQLGMGWMMDYVENKARDTEGRKVVYHSGSAVGATSYLVILPSQTEEQAQREVNKDGRKEPESRPRGVVVSLIANLDNDWIGGDLRQFAVSIAATFAD